MTGRLPAPGPVQAAALGRVGWRPHPSAPADRWPGAGATGAPMTRIAARDGLGTGSGVILGGSAPTAAMIDPSATLCASARADAPGLLPLIGERWFLPVVQQLSTGTKRYNQLRRDIPGISMRMLSRTLKHLQRDGLVAKTSFPVVPPHSEYRLTELGRSLLGPLAALTEWSLQHAGTIQAHRQRHAQAGATGTALPAATDDAPQAARRIVRFTSRGVLQQPFPR